MGRKRKFREGIGIAEFTEALRTTDDVLGGYEASFFYKEGMKGRLLEISLFKDKEYRILIDSVAPGTAVFAPDSIKLATLLKQTRAFRNNLADEMSEIAEVTALFLEHKAKAKKLEFPVFEKEADVSKVRTIYNSYVNYGSMKTKRPTVQNCFRHREVAVKKATEVNEYLKGRYASFSMPMLVEVRVHNIIWGFSVFLLSDYFVRPVWLNFDKNLQKFLEKTVLETVARYLVKNNRESKDVYMTMYLKELAEDVFKKLSSGVSGFKEKYELEKLFSLYETALDVVNAKGRVSEDLIESSFLMWCDWENISPNTKAIKGIRVPMQMKVSMRPKLVKLPVKNFEDFMGATIAETEREEISVPTP